jgi:hypothetical protein
VAEQKLKTHFAALYALLLVPVDDLNNMVGDTLALCDDAVFRQHAVKQHYHR